MPSFHTTRRVAHKASDMFALVADVERYPEFVPLCKGLRLLRREHHGTHETLTARMTVAYKLFTESFYEPRGAAARGARHRGGLPRRAVPQAA